MIDGLLEENMIKTRTVMKRLLFSLIALLVIGVAYGQSEDDWNWPEDKAPAEEKYVLYKDALRQDNYKAAKKPHNWLMKNVPDLHNSLYIDGIKIYEGLAEAENDPERKVELQDSTLEMYDLRIKHFNDEDVLTRKAYTAYKYYKSTQSKYDELYDIFSSAFEENGDDVEKVYYIIVPYMDVVRRHKLSGGDVSDEEVLQIYDHLSSLLNKMESQEVKAERVPTYRDNIDKLLTATVDVDCQFIEDNMWPKLEADPSNTNLAKKMMSLMYAGECTDTDVFLQTVEKLYNAEKNYSLAYILGIKNLQRENNDVAEEYLTQAIDLTEDNTKKAEIYMKLGDINNSQGKKLSARSYYMQTVQVDPSQKAAFEKIGDLYMGSYDQCRGGENMVKDRAVFLAAYDMYRKAGATQKMAQARSQFPSVEEAFTYDMHKGDQITVGCWINETVTLQTRD